MRERGCLGCFVWFVFGNGAVFFLAYIFLEHVPDDFLTQTIDFLEEHELALVLLANGLLFWWWWKRKRKANQ